MGKTHCNHRVVIRNQTGEITLDKSFDTFAKAKPYYDQCAHKLSDQHELTLQHGARIVDRSKGDVT